MQRRYRADSRAGLTVSLTASHAGGQSRPALAQGHPTLQKKSYRGLVPNFSSSFFLSFLWERKLFPVNRNLYPVASVDLFSHTHLVYCRLSLDCIYSTPYFAMASSTGTFISKAEIQDYTKALEVLDKDYPTRDGLDVDALLDSDKHGALTYNDFLILPGYIGAICRQQTLCRLRY